MSGEDLINLKKIEIKNTLFADLGAQSGEEISNKNCSGSVFDEINSSFQNVETEKNNLVEIEENEKDEQKEISWFKKLWQKLFPSKKTMTEDIAEEASLKTTTEDVTKEVSPKKYTEQEMKEIDYSILSKEDPKYTVNGKIDQDFKQGNTADCVLLAGLYSLSRSEKGAAIIQDAIKINYDKYGNTESYNVYFKGLDKTYSISAEEYCEAERLRPRYERGEVDRYLSAGDDDILLMELAYQKAFDDITEAKRSSCIFAQTDALTSVQYEQFLYAFVGTEDINSDYLTEMKYERKQSEINVPKIMEIFETQEEFKLEDVYMTDVEIKSMTYNSFKFDWEGTYVIEQKPSESENGEIIIKNKETGDMFTINAENLAEYFGGRVTTEQKKQIGSDMYDLAMESDFVFFINSSHDPIEITDVDGNVWSIFQEHAYGVKEITSEYLILINPHNSAEEIKISKDEYLKNYKTMGGFSLVSADFEE